MATRTRYLPLFAKAQLILGLGTVVVLLVLYPARKKEAEAYARAPVCAAQATEVAACRRMATAEVVRVDCPRANRGLEACQFELRVEGRKAFISLLREWSNRLSPGTPMRVEMMGGIPTSAELDGKLVRDYGSPEMAMAQLRFTAELQAVLTAAAAVYLLRRRRQTATREAAD